MKIKVILIFVILPLITLVNCVSSVEINPVYATKSINLISGEIALGSVTYPEPRYEDLYSLGAVRLNIAIDYFFKESLQDELSQFGFTVNSGARLEIDAVIRNAETVWRNQGNSGVFTTNIAIEFFVKDKERDNTVIYNVIHEGASSHSQSYGGYPASASVVDALGQVYERFLNDNRFNEILVATRSINLYGEQNNSEPKTGYSDKIYTNFENAVSDIMPDLIAMLEPFRFEDMYIAVFGFKNNNEKRNQFSMEIERKIRQALSNERFQTVTRELDDVLTEMELQMSDLFDPGTQVKIGSFIGADIIITGSLFYYTEENIIRLRIEIADVETAQIYGGFDTALVASRSYIDLLNNEF